MAMAEGRSRQQWQHTSHVLAMLANCLARAKGKPAFEPRQFDPHAAPVDVTPLNKEESSMVLRAIFKGGK